MSVALLKRAVAKFGPIFTQVYGLTEGLIGTIVQPHQHLAEGSAVEVGRLASAGQAFTDGEVRVVRPDGLDCAVDEIGEIIIGGPGNMSGYWNNHELTLQVLRHGWLAPETWGTSTRIAFCLLPIARRTWYSSGGENIYSREVEEALMLVPGRRVAVIGVPDQDGANSVKACIALRAGQTAGFDELVEHCRNNLAGLTRSRARSIFSKRCRVCTTARLTDCLRAPFWAADRRQVS